MRSQHWNYNQSYTSQVLYKHLWEATHPSHLDRSKTDWFLKVSKYHRLFFLETPISKKWKKFYPKGPIFSEKYWYYFHCPKNVLRSILSFVFWIFPPSDTAVQLESADSKHNTISKSLFQDSFRHIFWAMRKMPNTFWKKQPLRANCPNI